MSNKTINKINITTIKYNTVRKYLNMSAFIFWYPLSFDIKQVELVLIYMVLHVYWPTYSLMFSIHWFLHVGVYCTQLKTAPNLPLF